MALQAEFSDEAIALPFPPDAKELEFVAWAGDIKYTSQSPIKSLAAFYLKEMVARGWEHDESAAKVEPESIDLKFKHGKSEVKAQFGSGRRKCGSVWTARRCSSTASTIRRNLRRAFPRGAALFVQKELPLPTGAVNVQFTGEGCTLKSPLALQEAFDHFTKLAVSKGFRESRKPIIMTRGATRNSRKA